MSAVSSRKLLGGCLAFLALSSVHVAMGDDDAAKPKFDDVVKGMQAVNGMITFYRNAPDDDTKDHSKLMAVIPKALLNQDLLLSGTVTRGPGFGMPIDDGTLVRWTQNGNKVLLVAPNTMLKETGNEPVIGAVKNTYTDSLLASFTVAATDAQGGLLIDLSDEIYSGLGDITVNGVRRDMSKLVKVKSFPENSVVDVDCALSNRYGSSQGIGLSYAFRKLPALGGYTPRAADERIGYFTSVSRDWASKYSDPENVTRYINRWAIKKLDPSLEMSPPDKPIVFILEKTIPIQFRKYVADGISEWNKAFEKVGITGAIVVQQQTDDNEYASVDPDDARYNFIRWIVTGMGFAMGPSRADPRTGQLLDADIVFDDSMVRFYMQDNDILGPHAMSSNLGDQVLKFFRENPAFLPAGVKLPAQDQELIRPAATTVDSKGVQTPESTSARPEVHSRLRNARQCSLGNGMQQQLAFAQLAAAAAGNKKLPERLIGEIVKDVVTHEVGHTLGLRHNFKGSAWLTLDEIKKRRDTGDEATWSSVMDYNPYLYFPGDKLDKIRHFSSPTIGPYDYWAIEYGYSTVPDGKNEQEHLNSIAAKTNTRELAYATDEDVEGFDSPDPSANRFDMGSDPVAWAKMRIELADELLKSVKTWGMKKDEPNYYFRSTYSTLAFERVRYIPFVAREVTGIYESRSRAGDPNAPAPFTVIPPAKQREALKFISDTLFSESFFNADPELLNRLGANRWGDFYSYAQARTDYPVHSAVLSMQSGTLAALTNQTALERVYDSESKSKADDKFTAAELISTLRDNIWSELDDVAKATDAGKAGTDAKPLIGSFRRNLQQQYLQDVLSIAELKLDTGVSPDLQNMVRFSLRDLSGKIAKALENKDQIDFATRAHLSEAKVRIDRVLDAPFVPGNDGPRIYFMLGRETGAAAK